MVAPSDFYEQVLNQVRDVKESDPELSDLLSYYEKVLTAQQETSQAFQPDFEQLDLDVCRQRFSDGTACLAAEDIDITWALFDSLFDRIGMINRQDDDTSGEVATLPSISGRDIEWHQALRRGLLDDEGLLEECATQTGIDIDTFVFLAYQAVVPFVAAYAEHVSEIIDNDAWLKPRCPACGGEPLMARLEKETGQRVLQCHVCLNEWSFKRIDCPFCGNSDQDKLRFFYDEKDPSYRVDVCDECKGYLKTVDTRQKETPAILFVENLATLHLDFVARREEFTRNTNKMFGI